LLLPLSSTADDALLWFRPELTQTIAWGGDPNKPAEPDPIAGRLSPRKSFEAWKQTVRGHAVGWRDADLTLARELHDVIKAATASRARAEVEARFHFATEAGRMGVWELDLLANTVTASPMCRQIFGRDAEAPFTFEDMQGALHPDDRQRARAAIDSCIATGAALGVECRIERKGVTAWVRLQAQTERSEGGTALKLAGISLDITERVLTQERMRRSQQVEAVGRLTAGVAHDFNNLLLALGGSLELLLDEVGDRPAALEWGQIALRATARGKELTNRLLAFSRKQVLSARPLPIQTLFSELRGLIGHLFTGDAKAKSELVMIPCAPGLAVMADFAQLEAALMNLVVNARDAMAAGGCVRISAYAADADPAIVPPGRYTVISVADTGSGMDAATIAQACEPFFSTKGAHGTGLGLSMVQGFARQSGGEAHITSVLGRGTTIDLWLPSATASEPVEAAAEAPAQGRGEVLIVDDSPDALIVISAFLRHAGLSVTCQTTPDLAIAELAGGKRFDVVIADFAMPGMNGLELLARVRAIDPAAAGMIVTGFADPAFMSDLNGVVALRKPFNRLELTDAVQTLIAAKRLVMPGVVRKPLTGGAVAAARQTPASETARNPGCSAPARRHPAQSDTARWTRTRTAAALA
jgi:PAS domain S-box-containing protein